MPVTILSREVKRLVEHLLNRSLLPNAMGTLKLASKNFSLSRGYDLIENHLKGNKSTQNSKFDRLQKLRILLIAGAASE
jgi:hypothetical protein